MSTESGMPNWWEGGELEVVMPFVTVKSNGGPHDDVSFCAGYQVGQIDGELSSRNVDEVIYVVYAVSIRQADLIGMKYGYACAVLYEEGDWAQVGFTRIENWIGNDEQ